MTTYDVVMNPPSELFILQLLHLRIFVMLFIPDYSCFFDSVAMVSTLKESISMDQ